MTLRCIRAMTRRQAEITDTILRFRNLSLDRASFTLYTEKGALRLASKEFQLLEMLMETPDRLFPLSASLKKSGAMTVKQS